jgi:sulfite reductase (NADPH) flavoprotein alpha-component
MTARSGQVSLGLCLAAIVLALWRWHVPSLSWDAIEVSRVPLAAGVAGSWIALCVATWLRRRHVSTPVAARVGPLVCFASQTGFAERLARQTVDALRESGHPARLSSLAGMDASALAGETSLLFVVSTTGEGDAPDAVAGFIRQMRSPAELRGLRYGVLALGDRGYDDFCGFGHALDRWLRASNATPWFDLVEVDNGDDGALRHWQRQLGRLTGNRGMPGWRTPGYDMWTLATRTLLNPGSEGGSCFHLGFLPPVHAPAWRAGDIAEIGLPSLVPLQRREYSIASLPADGALELLVRQVRHDDGTLGQGSGWLTELARPGDGIALRVRANANFHAPDDDRPMLLVGNGTGLAGLRALLKERIARGLRRHWLVFGERHSAHDGLLRDELLDWHVGGHIECLDLVYSRDQAERHYVQHRLLERADEVRRWIDQGAVVYVCGSVEGMAPGVDAALRTIVGGELVDTLLETGRYRRDVY